MTRLILYNLQYLLGGSGKKWEYLLFWKRFFHPRKIEEEIVKNLLKHNPDILALVEVDTRSFNESEDYLAYFKKKLGMNYSVEKRKYHFRGFFKILNLIPWFRNNSNSVLSKWKMYDVKFFYFKHGIKRAIIKTSINTPRKIHLFLVHLSLGKNTRKKQLGELAQIVKEVKGSVIVAGDFNTFEGEREIQNFLKETGLKHKYKSAKRVFTYPSFYPRRRFDYILTSPKIKIKKYKILKLELSDHLPVLVDFN